MMKNTVTFEIMENLVSHLNAKMEILFARRHILKRDMENADSDETVAFYMKMMEENYKAMLPVMEMITQNYENARCFMDIYDK